MFGMYNFCIIFRKVSSVKLFFLIIFSPLFFFDFKFALFNFSENQQKEYEQALDDLKNSVKSKKFADIRSIIVASIEIVENQSKSTTNTKENICAIIRLFYSDCFLISLEKNWTF